MSKRDWVVARAFWALGVVCGMAIGLTIVEIVR